MATVTVTVEPNRPWQNSSNPLDVNADGFLSPIDALLIVNRINTIGPGLLPPPAGQSPPPFFDANGDGQVTPIDALLVINNLNNASGLAEGEDSVTLEVFVGLSDDRNEVGQVVLSFLPGYEEQRMPASLWQQIDPWSESRDSLVLGQSERYGDGVHPYPKKTDVYQEQRYSSLDDETLAEIIYPRSKQDSADEETTQGDLFASAVDEIFSDEV